MAGETMECDLLVAGSGAAGLTAALAARHHGLDVIVAEQAPVLGGTTARTAGSLWLPGNRLAAARGIEDTPAAVETYLRAMAGERFDEARVGRFIAMAPAAADFLLDHTAVDLFCPAYGSDYHPELPGGVEVGRAVYSMPFDGTALGDHLALLAPQLPELCVFGIMPQLGIDAPHFMRANRSPSSAAYVARRVAERAFQRMRYGRGTRLTNGAALAGRLIRSALDAGIPLWTASAVTALERVDGRIAGALVSTAGGSVRVTTRRGVVLACGGFSHDAALRDRHFPSKLAGRPYAPATAPGATGSGLSLATSVGGAVDDRLSDAAAWAPMMLAPRADGPPGIMPVLFGRAVPGVIAVMRTGERFVNEANSYHEFGQAMIAATPQGEAVFAWLICDARALRRYGLGFVRPFPFPHRRHLRSGALLRGRTLAELATAAGIDPLGLAATVAQFNADAVQGRDDRFGRGSTPYNRHMGDPAHRPNPALGPLKTGPYYAAKLVIGDIGTYVGLATDPDGRVLDGSGAPVAGLYAVGNDMASIFGGSYPAEERCSARRSRSGTARAGMLPSRQTRMTA